MLGVRDIHEDDYAGWLELWLANNRGTCDEEVTEETWNRLLTDIYPVHGLVVEKDGKIVGITHYVLHPVTGHLNPVCYMQDVFVDEDYRKQGVATAMIEHLAKIAHREEWARMYWLVENNNDGAHALYAHLGLKLNFSLYVHPLQN